MCQRSKSILAIGDEMLGLFQRKKKQPLLPSPELLQRVERLTQRLQRAEATAASQSGTDDRDDGTNTTGILTVATMDMPATADAGSDGH